ncbi:MAG TPA: hypothetical protein ENN65_00705 [Candidatus Hydrogenedentes bacterium]|nr:hypothetical protein [Candidatus Hydrogenedentota bacterium]
MTRAAMTVDYPTDYERAICYYTLPKVISPLTNGLIVIYAVLILEAIVALIIGLSLDNPTWTKAGLWGLLAMVALGAVIFIGRAVMNEVRERRMLAVAQGMPDSAEADADVPDPFEKHLLLQRPLDAPGKVFACEAGQAIWRYQIVSASGKHDRVVADTEGNTVCRLVIHRLFTSFSLDSGLPAHVHVFRDNEEIARIDRRFSFNASVTAIQCVQPQPARYVIRNECIYADDRMIGRIYLLRRALYLDLEEAFFHEAFLAYLALQT